MSRVFTRFWRGSKRGGTGLGLYIVKGIVEAHGGTITVGRGPGGGAEFRFILPVAPRPTWPEQPAGVMRHSHPVRLGLWHLCVLVHCPTIDAGTASQPIGSTGRDVGTE